MVVDHICVNYGTELFQELFNKLQVRGVEQNVFYPRNRRHRIGDTGRPYQIESPLVLNAFTKASFLRKRLIMRQHYDPVFHKNKPDLIHAHTFFSDGSLAYDRYKKYQIPYIVAVRSTDMDVFMKYRPWLLAMGKQIAENASFIVFISPSIKKKFLKKFGEKYENKSLIIPNGINQDFIQNRAQIQKEIHTPVRLLYVGDFRRRKNVPALIKLAAKTGSTLTIVGKGGKQEKKVLRMIRKVEGINYPGRIDNLAELRKIYSQSDIFIMTSRRETFGLVYLEAMSQGLPLIYSFNTGIDGLFEEGRVGYGVKPGSLSDMKVGIDKIIANYKEISGNCVAEVQKFNWTDIADRYKELYSRVES